MFHRLSARSSSPSVTPRATPHTRIDTTAIKATSETQHGAPVTNAFTISLPPIEPLLVRAARGESVERAPCWSDLPQTSLLQTSCSVLRMMRQAGRYQKAYQDIAERYPSFRKRSETTELIVEISLIPWRSFKPDGVIIFSDILTILPAIGMSFEIDDIQGPIIANPIRSAKEVERLTALRVDQLSFVGESLKLLREEIKNEAAVLGFVGAPWTIATYIVEGKSSTIYKNIKTMTGSDPQTLHQLLSFLSEQIAQYVIYQIESGAQVVQIFDSWGGQLPPRMWDQWSKPYIKHIVDTVKDRYPHVPLTLYANGSGGLIERLPETGVDVIGIDWTVDMKDARSRLGSDIPVQGNIDPCVLFGEKTMIKNEIMNCIKSAGNRGHILNLGHGVIVGTPEDNVSYFFDLSKELMYADVFDST